MTPRISPMADRRTLRKETRQRRREEKQQENLEELRMRRIIGISRGSVILVTSICGLFAIFTLIPIAWIAINSTKTEQNIFSTSGFWFAAPFHLFQNLSLLVKDVSGEGVYVDWLKNTAIYAAVGGLGATLFSAMAGYGFAHYRFRGHRGLYYVVLATLLVPISAITLPLYFVYAKVGLINNILGMIFPSMVAPVGVLLMRVYISSSVPREVIDSARIDGAGEGRIFVRIALPLMIPGLTTVLLLSIVGIWNNYFLPLLIFSDNTRYPITEGLGLWATHASTSGNMNIYTLLVVGGLVTIIPSIVLFLFLQRYWRGGALLGSVAGA